ncbi:substrate import-associated zinc metallohydrolase lipoprotein [Pedobacter changchengzhani]|nr:substrate import-associated zinc metallohydrolase lipoprotein [Pedobacter changchengzhani]
MKNIIFKSLMFLTLFSLLLSCKKEAKLNVDLTKSTVDNPTANSPLDAWLKSTFLDEYNMDIVYKYNRYKYSNDVVVSAPDTTRVRPQMQAVLNAFLLPYRKAAGATFIKKNTPKEWVLFGSPAYQTNGSSLAGTASAGRNITLYDVNSFNVNDPGSVVGKIYVIHHEFTHILNQLVPIPDDFKTITASTYNANWPAVSDQTAKDNGYVSAYASGSYIEDFAETNAVLLVYGEIYFRARANGSTPAGKAALLAKQASVIQYYTLLGIDFRTLQKEVQKVLKDSYSYQSASFPSVLNQGGVSHIPVDPSDAIYAKYPNGSQYTAAFNDAKAKFALKGYNLDYLDFVFNSTTKLSVVAYFSGGGVQYNGVYDFSYTVDPTSGATKFTRIADQGTGNQYGNANYFATEFSSSIESYLTQNNFTADYLPTNIDDDNLGKYGGFYVTGSPSNFFYGPLQ